MSTKKRKNNLSQLLNIKFFRKNLLKSIFELNNTFLIIIFLLKIFFPYFALDLRFILIADILICYFISEIPNLRKREIFIKYINLIGSFIFILIFVTRFIDSNNLLASIYNEYIKALENFSNVLFIYFLFLFILLFVFIKINKMLSFLLKSKYYKNNLTLNKIMSVVFLGLFFSFNISFVYIFFYVINKQENFYLFYFKFYKYFYPILGFSLFSLYITFLLNYFVRLCGWINNDNKTNYINQDKTKKLNKSRLNK